MNEVGKKELEMLLHNTWIVKEQDADKYYAVKNKLDTIKSFITNQLGSKLIVHPKFIKLEKVPVVPKSYMGIDSFEQPFEYVLLVLVLLYLEDKPAGEQFILSWLIEFINTTSLSLDLDHVPDWNLIQHRRSLVKVLNYLRDIYAIKVCDEEKTSFIDDVQSEGLYETTGISNYLMRVFKNDIFDFHSLEDFQNDEWMNQMIDKGEVRRYRIYRSLTYTPVMYHTDFLESDIDYIKKQRGKIKTDLEQYTDAELEVTKNMSVIFYPFSNQKQYFPNNKTISDITLMMNTSLLKYIEDGEIPLDQKEIAKISETMMTRLVKDVRKDYHHYLSKYHRDLTFDKFYQEVISYMESYGFIERIEDGYNIYPMVGRLIGEAVLNKQKKTVEQIDLFGGNI